MEGAYHLLDFYDHQKANYEFGLANLAFEGQIRAKETRASTSVWKLRQPQNGSIGVEFLLAFEINFKKKIMKF